MVLFFHDTVPMASMTNQMTSLATGDQTFYKSSSIQKNLTHVCVHSKQSIFICPSIGSCLHTIDKKHQNTILASCHSGHVMMNRVLDEHNSCILSFSIHICQVDQPKLFPLLELRFCCLQHFQFS